MNATRRRAVSRVSRLARSAAAPARQGHQRQTGAPATPRAPEGADRTALVRRPTSTPLGQSSLGDRDQARAAGAGRDLGIPAAVAKKLHDGKLEQSCPDCGRWEAAGSYCSGCDRRMGPDDWYPNGDLTRRAVAREKAAAIASTRVKRAPGRPRAELDSSTPAVTAPAYSPDAGFWPA